MARNTLKADMLGNAAIGAVINNWPLSASVDHKAQIYAIQQPPVQEFLLAAKITDDSLVSQAFPVFHFNQFLSGNRNQPDFSAQSVQNIRLRQGRGKPQQCC